MKLFIASDLHGSLPATEKMIAAYQASGADWLVLLGDLLNHGPRNPIPDGYQPSIVAERLNLFAHKIIAVRGNCDSEVDQMLLNFPMMEAFSWILLENGQRLFLTHGHLYHQDHLPTLATNDVLIHGHTHLPVARQYEHYVLFNPGSTTFPREAFPPSYGLYESGAEASGGDTSGTLRVLDFSGHCLKQVCLT